VRCPLPQVLRQLAVVAKSGSVMASWPSTAVSRYWPVRRLGSRGRPSLGRRPGLDSGIRL